LTGSLSCLLKELLKYFILFATMIECKTANVSNSDFSKNYTYRTPSKLNI
jgi:hypothetical protein